MVSHRIRVLSLVVAISCALGTPADVYADSGCGGCLIGFVCYADGSPNPANDCLKCNINNSITSWSFANLGDPCQDDGNECTQDLCNAVGLCEHTEFAGIQNCDDGDSCTQADFCFSTTCTGLVVDCDDGDPCTDDSCDSATGCIYDENTGAVCEDDNNECTEDVCKNGQCTHDPYSDVVQCDDASVCTQFDFCLSGNCTGQPISCADGNPCTDDTCDALEGCKNPNNSEPCDEDADECTQDICFAGACTHPPATGTPCSPDSDPCTEDICINGGCTHFLGTTGLGCEDGNLCTSGETCQELGCTGGTVIVCDDGNVCTDDSCNPGSGCIFTSNIAGCDDGNPCTSNDTCELSACTNTVPTVCNDGDPCTNDSCDVALGCQTTVNNSTCEDDGDLCTQDVCNNGVCTHPSVADGANCNDGDLCTENDKCFGGTCGGGTVDCDDGNVCTTDSCDGVLGCQNVPNTAPCTDDGNDCTGDICNDGVCGHVPINEGVTCDDSNFCTTFDKCQAGLCTGNQINCNDGNECTDDSCNPSNGACQFTPSTGACADDGNDCTVDECVDTECIHTPNNVGMACDDDDVCTDNEVCIQDGICEGELRDCNDGNECTQDGCDSLSGGCIYTNLNTTCTDEGDPCTADVCSNGLCTHTAGNDGASCDDNNVCSIGDKCSNGSCSGFFITCDDNNVCTTDTCDAVNGCTFVNNTAQCAEDGDPCTVDVCSNGACEHPPGNDNTVCDDGSACTETDVCSQGICGGTPVVCEDNDGCTDNQCAPAIGCQFPFNSAPCQDDGNQCTEDICSDGTCLHKAWDDATFCNDDDACTFLDICAGTTCTGLPVTCDDGDPCTNDVCISPTGCSHPNNTASCDDSNPCTENDVCSDGTCDGSAVTCDDGNPCTDDSCDPATGCTVTFNTGSCDDGNSCTTNDLCADGVCIGGQTNCDDGDPCTSDSCVGGQCQHANAANGILCDDNSACTSFDFCLNGECSGVEVECNDGNECTSDSCDPVTGCEATPISGTLCDDGNPCTANDSCSAGTCIGGSGSGGAVSCDDGDPCTDDSCEPSQGCVHTFNTAPCGDDGDSCTADVCQLGNCVHPAVADNTACADDGNACTDDICLSGECVHPVGSNNVCDDNDPCTESDFCIGANCTGLPVDCDDGNECTDDSCAAGIGCSSLSNTAYCTDDNNVCTKDVCDGGICTHPPDFENFPCDDGQICTDLDRCQTGSCVGTEKVCDDGDPCTNDFCDVVQGCLASPATGTLCEDGNLCTVNDHCKEGVCLSGNVKPCEAADDCHFDGTCNSDTGICDNAAKPDGVVCDDASMCTSGTTCQQGVCTPANTSTCDDGNPCTDDNCHPTQGCAYWNHQGDCDDGDPCTSGDSCFNGECLSGEAESCDDQLDCTVDSCEPGIGCVHVATNTLCDDADSCTTDTCDAVTGCQYSANTGACDDGDSCTTDDVCVDNQCVGQTVVTCDDGNICTDDDCDATTGCTFTANANTCDDNNPCTANDTCIDGICNAVGPTLCDDENPCTDDSCDPAVGCQYQPNSLTLSCYDGPANTIGKGVCKPGTQQCSGGTMGACLAQVVPGLEYCGNGIDEDCDGLNDEINGCLPGVMPVSGADVQFDIASSDPGLLKGQVTDTGSGYYQQDVVAMMSQPPGSAGLVHASLGDLTASRSITTQMQPTAWIHGIVRTPELWADVPIVHGHVQVRDAVGRPQVLSGTQASLTVSLAGQMVSASCTVDALGMCDVSVEVPDAWFSLGSIASAEAVFTTANASTVIETVHIHPRPDYGSAIETPHVVAVAPLGPRHAGSAVLIPVIAEVQTNVLEAYDIEVEVDASVLNVGDVLLADAYTGTVNVQDGVVQVAAVRKTSAGDAETTGTIPLFVMHTDVVSNATPGSTSLVAGTVKQLSDDSSVTLLSNEDVVVHDGTGTSASGTVTVAINPVRGIVAVAPKVDLFNTAVLTGEKITSAIQLRTIRSVKPDHLVAGVCQSDDPSVLVVAPGCVPMLIGSESKGASQVGVDVTYGGFTATVPFRVWHPVNVSIKASDAVLQPIDGVVADCANTATPQYQRASVYVEAQFQAGVQNVVTARVDDFVTVQSSNDAVAVVEDNQIHGVSTGGVLVQAVNGAEVLASQSITVTNSSPVDVQEFYLVVATDISVPPLNPAPPLSVDSSASAVVTATLNQAFQNDGDKGHVFAYASLSDGTRMTVTADDGFEVSSLNLGVLTADQSPPSVTAVGSGAGEFVQGMWNVCDQTLHTATVFVNVVVPEPVDAGVSVTHSSLARHSDDPAGLAGIPIETPVSVTMELANGDYVDYTLDSRTIYDAVTGDPNDLIDVKVVPGEGGNVSAIHVVPTGLGSGTAMLTVRFEHVVGLEASIPVTVVAGESLVLVAHPSPEFPGSSSIIKDTLHEIEDSNFWEKAVLELSLSLSNGNVLDVSDNANVTYGLFETGSFDPTSKVTFVDVNLIQGHTPGVVDVRALLGGMWSAPFVMTVVSEPVSISNLVIALPETLSGIKDEATFQAVVTASLSDGTTIENAEDLVGLFDYSSSRPDVASVKDDGVVTLHANHNDFVTISVTTASASTTATTNVACNLSPTVGDVDLGQLDLLAHPDVNPGDFFEMPVRINTGGQSLGGFDITVRFDSSVIEAVSVSAGPHWEGSHLDATVDEVDGEIHIVGAAAVTSDVESPSAHVATIHFKGLKDGDKTTTLISGDIRTMFGNEVALPSIGAPIAFGDEPRAIVAGHGVLDPDCPNGAVPDEILGNANGDCGFSVGDVSTVLFHLVDLVPTNTITEAQMNAMDADKNGVVEVLDAVYLLRVLADKYRFVDLQITPPTDALGTATFVVALHDKEGQPKSDRSRVFFELKTELEMSALQASTGAILEPTNDGVVVAAANMGDGTYRADVSGFLSNEDAVGVVVIVESLNVDDNTSPDRRVALHGSPWLNENSPYIPMGTFLVSDGLPGSPCTSDADCIAGGNASAACVDQLCVSVCDEGTVDIDQDIQLGPGGNGCECVVNPEWCDGFDNDCDGSVDNGYEGLGEECTVGEGTCGQTGVQVCRPDGTAVECSVTALADGASCDDGQPCTVDDICIAGVCSGATRECAVGTMCYEGVCLDSQCQPCTLDTDCGVGSVCEPTDDGNRCFRMCAEAECRDTEVCVPRDDDVLRCVSSDETVGCRPLNLPPLVEQVEVVEEPVLPPSSTGDGCGCRVQRQANTPWGAALLVLLVLGLWFSRRVLQTSRS